VISSYKNFLFNSSLKCSCVAVTVDVRTRACRMNGRKICGFLFFICVLLVIQVVLTCYGCISDSLFCTDWLIDWLIGWSLEWLINWRTSGLCMLWKGNIPLTISTMFKWLHDHSSVLERCAEWIENFMCCWIILYYTQIGFRFFFIVELKGSWCPYQLHIPPVALHGHLVIHIWFVEQM
jgi:hypothetical protein